MSRTGVSGAIRSDANAARRLEGQATCSGVAGFLLQLGATGNVRTTTLRAFEWADAQDLIEG